MRFFSNEVSHRTSFLESLDGLRALAVLAVVFSHTSNEGMMFTPFLDFRRFGQFGVFLFFFLSSFLLSRPYFQKPELVFSKNDWGLYFVRRFLRIAPLFYVVIIIDYLFIHFYLDPASVHMDRWPHQLLVEHLLFIKGGSVFWTIPVEMRFYIVLPVFVMFIHLLARSRIGRLLILFLFAAWFTSIYVFDLTHATAEMLNNPLQTLFIHQYVPFFVAGICMSFIQVRYGEAIQATFFRVRWLLELAAAAMLIVMVTQIPSVWYWLKGVPFVVERFDFETFLRVRIVPFCLFFSVLTFGFLNGTGYIKRLLSLAPLKFVGRISFSVYALHYLVIHFVKALQLSSAIQTLLVFAITIGSSTLTFLWIERPFMMMTKKSHRR